MNDRLAAIWAEWDYTAFKKYIRDIARDTGNELAAQRREIEQLEVENDTLQTQVDDLTEQVTRLEADNLELAKALNGLEEDYAVVRTRLGIYGR